MVFHEQNESSGGRASRGMLLLGLLLLAA